MRTDIYKGNTQKTTAADGSLPYAAVCYFHRQDFEIREYGSGKSLCGDMGYIRECGIVFLDINMDGMDGLDAARQIKAECPNARIIDNLMTDALIIGEQTSKQVIDPETILAAVNNQQL